MFRKFALIILMTISFLLLSGITFLQAQPDWAINKFSSRIEIQKDATLLINERIDVNLNIYKHGIYRTIPVHYKDNWGNNYSLILKVISVTDDQGREYQTKITYEGRNIKIQIGDPNKMVTGQYIYNIYYSVKRGLIYGENQDELYWNVTGLDWEVPMNNVEAEIILPQAVEPSKLDIKCFTGTSTQPNINSTFSTSGNIINAQAGDFLTVSVKFPTGLVTKPGFLTSLYWFMGDNWFIFAPFLVFILMLIIWVKKGKEPKGKGTIVPEYEPPDKLSPTEVGLILDNAVSTKEISATIIDLAVRGYIRINDLGDKDYQLELLKDYSQDANLKEYEKMMLNDLFSSNTIKVSNLKNKFYKYLGEIKSAVIKNLIATGYYERNPLHVKMTYMSIGIILAILGFLLATFQNLGLAGMIALTLCGVIVMIFSFFMPRRSLQGVLAEEKILGFRLYIKTAEEGRLKFEEKENIFEKFLPYALVFGLSEKWAKAFEGIYKEPPSWYYGYAGAYSTVVFAGSLSSFDSSLSTAFTSSPSGSGGGGAGGGGGFGGGGGGTW